MIKFDSLFEDKILVRKRAEEKITKSGIIIPDQFIENRWRGRHAPEEPKEGIIIAADTVVVLNDEIIGKPKSEEEYLRCRLADRLARKHTDRLAGVDARFLMRS